MGSGVQTGVDSPEASPREQLLEEYANAVRAYQKVVLELQTVELLDPAIFGSLLQRVLAAKGIVNQYRSVYGHAV
ncbi:MAG: hypothetical protein ACJ746_05595 [Bryobacteraceae bacterium]